MKKEEEWVMGEREDPMEEDADPPPAESRTGEVADVLTAEEAEATSEIVLADLHQCRRGKRWT